MLRWLRRGLRHKQADCSAVGAALRAIAERVQTPLLHHPIRLRDVADFKELVWSRNFTDMP